ncbi:MAG: dihydroneopterin aldolase [Polyangiaceae bacterium]
MIREYTLRLHGVRFRASIGASAAERAIPQDLVVDVDLELPVSALPKRDAKREVVDYDHAVRLVVEVGLAEPYRLLEVYAQRVLERLLLETPALRVRVAVTKSRVPSTYSTDQAVVELIGSRDQ